jgi:uncharacterized Tic20 family protein
MREAGGSILKGNNWRLFMVTQDEKNMALMAHLLSLITGFVAPLIIWLIKKDQSSFVEQHAKEALNFQISVYIYGVVSGILVVVLIGIIMLFVLGVAAFILIIIATLKAAQGESYRYPFTIRLLK